MARSTEDVEWGKATADWVAGEGHVHLAPCDASGVGLVGKPNIIAYIISPEKGEQ